MASKGLGTLTLDLVAKIGGFTGPLNKAERDLDARTKRMNKMANDFGRTIGAGLKSAATGFLAFAGVAVSLDSAATAIKGAIDRADQLRDASIRLGVGVETLSAYGYAAQQTGTDIEELNKGLLRLTRNATEALDPKSSKAGLFQALGVSRDALTDLDKLIPQVADAFAGMEDGATKAALAQELFGRSGANLIEFLNQGAAGLQGFTDRARELGVVIGDDVAAAADEFNDKLADLRSAGTGLATQVASELLPQLTQLVEWATDFVSDGDNARQIANDIADGFRAMADAGQAFGQVIGVFERAREVLQGLEKQAQGTSLYIGSILTLNERMRSQGMELYRQGTGQINGQPKPQQAQASPWSGPMNLSYGTFDKPDNTALNRYLSTGGRTASGGGSRKSGGGGGKSDEQREAEQLLAAYNRLKESMSERIALFGVESEVAKLSYDLQNGELAKLTQAQKDELMVRALKLDAMESARKEIDSETEAMKRQKEALQDQERRQKEFIDDLKFEIGLYGLSNKAKERAIALRYAEVDATSDLGKEIAALSDIRYEARETEALMDDLKSGLSDMFVDFASGAKSAKEAFGDFADYIYQRALQFLADKAIQALIDAFDGDGKIAGKDSSGGSGWANLVGAFVGAFGGGKASGGWAAANTVYEVNERGFEMARVGNKDYMLTGPNPVHITPNHALRGNGVSNTNNFYYQAPPDPRTQQQTAARVAFETRRATARN